MSLSVQTTLFVKSLSLPLSIKGVHVVDLVKNKNKAVDVTNFIVVKVCENLVTIELSTCK